MKKINLFLFSFGISLLSCTNTEKRPISSMSDIATDFPTTERLEFKPFNKYDSLIEGDYMIDELTIWNFTTNDPSSVGYCYDLNTGEKLSMIASIGKANNELLGVDFRNSKMTDDSIHLYSSNGYGVDAISVGGEACKSIKTFAKKDITKNVPLGERRFSVITRPDSINASKMAKLPNGSGIVTILGKLGKNPMPEKFNINNKSVVIFNDNEAKGYQTIDYDSFDIKVSHPHFETNYVIKTAYADGDIEVKDSNMAAFSVRNQFILYTLNLKNGKVMNEKRYTKMQLEGLSAMALNDMKMRINLMKSNKKYIFCVVSGYLSKEDKELAVRKNALLVFDWNLKPIKRFELPDAHSHEIIISQDCSSIFISEMTEEGLILTKADLNI